jgi:hypothetical protein
MNDKTLATVLAKVKEHEAHGKLIYYVPEDGSSYIGEAKGYRVAVVVAGEDGFHWTGTWPYHGKIGETMPYFWGPSLEAAQRQCAKQNARLGVTTEEAILIVGRSMARASKRGKKGKK